MIQSKEELEEWHNKRDPWEYLDNKSDLLRKEILLSEIPQKKYKNVLDIGCGQGFITSVLPGNSIYGVDISQSAIDFANKVNSNNVIYKQGSIFEIDKLFDIKFDLIIITGVLYNQYIGNSSNLIYMLIDFILEKDGNLVTVHIDEWYNCRFPYLKTTEIIYPYREFNHKLEIYCK